MSAISTGNSALDQISNSYQATDQKKTEDQDALGRDTFLKMMVAQLQNQDPLSPMDGTDFSAQLAQFSQLEQLISLNSSMEKLANSASDGSEGDAMNFIGKQVTGTVETMNVDEGTVSGGFYNLGGPADIMVTIQNSEGETIKTLFEGQQDSGSHLISWDGTNNGGDAVGDGTYHYTVMANSGYGFSELPSSVTGNVEGITYNDGKPFLVVEGILLDPESLTAVFDPEETQGDDSVESTLSYLGKNVTSNAPIVQVEDGSVVGEELSFNLETPGDVTIKVYDAFDELISTINIAADDTEGGDNTAPWDGLTATGHMTSDGLYYYTATAGDGFAKTSVSEEVTGVKYMNGTQYLELKDSGRLIRTSSITGINQ